MDEVEKYILKTMKSSIYINPKEYLPAVSKYSYQFTTWSLVTERYTGAWSFSPSRNPHKP